VAEWRRFVELMSDFKRGRGEAAARLRKRVAGRLSSRSRRSSRRRAGNRSRSYRRVGCCGRRAPRRASARPRRPGWPPRPYRRGRGHSRGRHSRGRHSCGRRRDCGPTRDRPADSGRRRDCGRRSRAIRRSRCSRAPRRRSRAEAALAAKVVRVMAAAAAPRMSFFMRDLLVLRRPCQTASERRLGSALSAIQTAKRQTWPSATIRPAVGAEKWVPITSVCAPASAPYIRLRVAVEATAS